jgi:hypothetical protein
MRKRTQTKSSSSEAIPFEADKEIRFEAAAILASASPLSVDTMGTFPLSTIALGYISRRHFADTDANSSFALPRRRRGLCFDGSKQCLKKAFTKLPTEMPPTW